MIRKWYLTKILKIKIGKHSFIHLGCIFSESPIIIGEHTVIGRNCWLTGEIKIGNNCSISAYTIIQSVTHDKNSPTFAAIHLPITIEDYVWIGFRSIILPGVTINKGAIIGANSTVNKNVPALNVYAGSPAKKISIRSEEALQYNLNYHPPFN